MSKRLVGRCRSDAGRAMFERIDYELTVTSPRPIDNLTFVQAGGIRTGSVAPTYFTTAAPQAFNEESRNYQCAGKGATASQLTVDLGTVRPEQTAMLTVWTLMIGAIAAGEPRPSLSDLAHNYVIVTAQIQGMNFGPEPWGPRVMSCDNITGDLISVASPPPETISSIDGSTICHPNP